MRWDDALVSVPEVAGGERRGVKMRPRKGSRWNEGDIVYPRNGGCAHLCLKMAGAETIVLMGHQWRAQCTPHRAPKFNSGLSDVRSSNLVIILSLPYSGTLIVTYLYEDIIIITPK